MKREAAAASASASVPRVQPRRKVFLPVALRLGEERHRAHLLNVSVGGASLHARVPLRMWSAVAIELDDRVLDGRVSWVAGDRCGVRFARPLAASELDALCG